MVQWQPIPRGSQIPAYAYPADSTSLSQHMWKQSLSRQSRPAKSSPNNSGRKAIPTQDIVCKEYAKDDTNLALNCISVQCGPCKNGVSIMETRGFLGSQPPPAQSMHKTQFDKLYRGKPSLGRHSHVMHGSCNIHCNVKEEFHPVSHPCRCKNLTCVYF